MAAPNIVGVTTITGITTFVSLTTTNPTLVLSNAANSNSVMKINSIIVANIDGTSSCDVTVKVHNAAAGAGVSFSLASTISVVADSTLVVLDKASSIYLEENRSITAQASAANDLDIICSYELIR